MYIKFLAVALVIVCGLIGWKTYNYLTAYDKLRATPYNQYLGAENPAVTITEIMDYRCAHCRMIHDVITEFLALNPDVRIVFRMYPTSGNDSIREAKLAMVAGRQGKFREMHEKLMRNEKPLLDQDIEIYMAEVGLDKEQFIKDITDWEISQDLLNTVNAAGALKINRTPTFIAGKTIYSLSATPTVEDLQKIVEAHRPGAKK